MTTNPFKKFNRKVLILALLLFSCSPSILAATYDFTAVNEGTTIYYEITTVDEGPNTVSVATKSSTNTYSGDVVIPETVTNNGTTYTVTGIGDNAFKTCKSLTSVSIPSSVTSIGTYAFYNCSGLTSITIPDNVTSIGNYAFYGCSGFTSIELPTNLITIGDRAFYNCSGLTSSIEIPSSVESIGTYAFYGCSSLSSVTFSNVGNPSLTTIGDRAFYNCSSLSSITIPSSLTSLGTYAFYGCSNLSSVTFSDATNSNLTSIPNCAFQGCSSLTSIELPESVTEIGNSAFNGCTSLETIIINGTLSSLGSNAFEGCSSLTTVTGFESATITKIGTCAFEGCSSLTSITIPSTVTWIDSNAFDGCSSLTSITIPSNVSIIGQYAFQNCSMLANVTFDETASISTIEAYMFNGCSSLESITIPSSVTSLGNSCFKGCSKLKNVTFSEDLTKLTISNYAFADCTSLESITIPSVVSSIGLYAFQNCSSLTTVEGLAKCEITSISNYTFDGCTSLTSINIPDNITSIGDYAFSNSGLESIEIPSTVSSLGTGVFSDCSSLKTVIFDEGSEITSISDYLFYNCSNLSSISLPDGITSIGNYSFYGCTSFTSEIPSNVESIGDYAFYGCTNLTSDIPSSVETIGDYAFFNTGLETIEIPSSLTSIGTGAFANCSSLTAFTISSSTTGSTEYYSVTDGVLFNADGTKLICYPAGKTDITNYTTSDGVTKIDACAFYGCTNLTTITLSYVETIGDDAFINCDATIIFGENANYAYEEDILYRLDSGNKVELIKCPTSKTSVTISTDASMTAIAAYAFSGCSDLTSIEIPSNVTTIGEYAFNDCTELESFEISGNATIGDYAFNGCTTLSSITLPSSVTDFSLGDYVFSGCTSLTSLDYENDITGISDDAFSGSSITTLTIGNDVTKTLSAFSKLAALTTVNFKATSASPSGTTSDFANCSNFTTLTIDEGVTSLDKYMFKNCKSLTTINYNATDCTIPKSSTYDIDSPFIGCNALETVTIGNKVDSIPPYLFYGIASSGFSNLTEINIPTSVKSIGNYAFANCNGLTTLNIPGNETDGTTIGTGSFMNCYYLQNATIGDDVTSIGGYAFRYCLKLENVSIGKKVESIGDCAFQWCEALTSIEIPSSVKSVGFCAFMYCLALKDAKVYGNTSEATHLGYNTFAGCEKLETLTLGYDDPDNDDVYGKVSADWGTCVSVYSDRDTYNHSCESLKTLTIGKGVEKLSLNAFYYCTALETIYYNAIDCNTLLSPRSDSDILDSKSVSTYDAPIFENCPNVSTLIIGDEVEKIPDYLFSAKYLSDSGIYPYTDTQHFGGVTKVDIPKSVTYIGKNAFYGCENLKTLTIEEGVDEISEKAFYRCNALETVYEKRSLEKLEGDENDDVPEVPTAGTKCFTKYTTGWDDNVDDFPKCFLVVPEDAARFYTAPDGDGNTESDYLGYGAIAPTSVDENGNPTEDEGWATIPYLREDAVTIEILTAEGYATHYSPYSYTLDSNLKYGVITGADSETGDLQITWDSSEDHIVPAGSAILIKGVKGTAYSNETKNTTYTTTENSYSKGYVYNPSSSSIMYGTVNKYYNETESKQQNGVTDVPTDNDYSASNYSFYKLSYYTNEYGVKELGFYRKNANGEPFKITGGAKYDSGVKLAWLAIPKEDDDQSGVRAFYPLDNNSTGIEAIEASQPNGDMQGAYTGNDAIYNLQGMKIKEMKKGNIYIINGKKYFAK